MAWVVDPVKRTVAVHRSPIDPVMLKEQEELTGDDVLPGFSVRIAIIFERADGKRGE
jgi:Uma2 family endonuclease